MKGLVATPFITISKSMSSHRAAQGVIYADQLTRAGKDITVNMTLDLYHHDFNQFDELYVYHGNDWSGNVNLFGGLKSFPYVDNFVNFSKFKGKVYSLVIDHPNYYEMIKTKLDETKQKGKDYDPQWDQVDWSNLKRMCETAETIVPNDLVQYSNIAIGDSHAICMYRPGWQNLSVPFKTLHGALKSSLESFIHNKDGWYTNIEYYFGNIDVRNHLLRQSDPKQATIDIVKEYVKQAHAIADRYDANVKIYELLPIENESRSIPKTGWYKGTPFYGTRADRNNIRVIFKEEVAKRCKSDRVQLYEWVGAMINSSGELSFDCMEKPQSVHLSRKWYPHWQGHEYNKSQPINYTPIAERKSNSVEDFFT